MHEFFNEKVSQISILYAFFIYIIFAVYYKRIYKINVENNLYNIAQNLVSITEFEIVVWRYTYDKQ